MNVCTDEQVNSFNKQEYLKTVMLCRLPKSFFSNILLVSVTLSDISIQITLPSIPQAKAFYSVK